jgi:hypothetical protein
VDVWFDIYLPELRDAAISIIRLMLKVLKYCGIDKNGEELIVSWIRIETSYSSLHLSCV